MLKSSESGSISYQRGTLEPIFTEKKCIYEAYVEVLLFSYLDNWHLRKTENKKE